MVIIMSKNQVFDLPTHAFHNVDSVVKNGLVDKHLISRIHDQ